jgi:hypothetical protein
VSKRFTRWSRRAVVPIVVLGLCAAATPANAADPAPTAVRAEKFLSASITVTYVPGAKAVVVPGGDAVWGFTCKTKDDGAGNVDVHCDRIPVLGVTLVCSTVTVTGTTPATLPYSPRLTAEGSCSNADDTWTERLVAPGSVPDPRPHVNIPTYALDCHVAAAPTVAYTVTCAFAGSVRQSILGGVTMTADETGAVTFSLWGVLNSSQWTCFYVIWPTTSPGPPTVRCEAVPTPNIQWYCNQTAVTVVAPTPATRPQTPLRVRGQVSCDKNDTFLPSPGTYSTQEVPTLGNAEWDNAGGFLNMDTDTFICQAWGPLNTPLPIGPWVLDCAEP